MYQVPTQTWNEIARSQRLRSQMGLDLFHLDQEQMLAAVAEREKLLERKGVDPKTTRAFVQVAPMLLENEAISRYVQAESLPSLRSCLPELTSINEAVDLATKEYRLNTLQMQRLRKLLQAEYPRPSADSDNKKLGDEQK